MVLGDEAEEGERTGPTKSGRKRRHQSAKDVDAVTGVSGSTGIARGLGGPSGGVLDLDGGCEPLGVFGQLAGGLGRAPARCAVRGDLERGRDRVVGPVATAAEMYRPLLQVVNELGEQTMRVPALHRRHLSIDGGRQQGVRETESIAFALKHAQLQCLLKPSL